MAIKKYELKTLAFRVKFRRELNNLSNDLFEVVKDEVKRSNEQRYNKKGKK